MPNQPTTIFAFYKGRRRLFNKLVAWKTGGPYSHCEAVFGLNPMREKKVYQCASASFTDGGVRFKDIELHPENWDLIEVPGVDAAKVRKWFELREGQPYDNRGVLNFIIPVGQNRAGWFCNEACGMAADVPQPHRFDPTGLACIFERIGGVWIQGGPTWKKATQYRPAFL